VARRFFLLRTLEGAAMPGDLVCSHCAQPMEEGFMIDHTYMQKFVATWFAGKPVTTFWRGLVGSGNRKLPMTAYRCNSCGKVELFAR
jgi:hypothetical protein